MGEILRDPAWQFVGAVLAALAVGVTLGVHWLQKQRKRLSYELVYRNRLLTVTEEHQNNIQVTYDGETVRDLCILVIRIVNSGNVPIAEQDFATPVSISVGNESRILSAAVTETDPKELVASVESQSQGISLRPTLMNPGDTVTVKMLVSDYAGAYEVGGRILGVKSVDRLHKPTTLSNIAIFAGLICTLVGGYLYFAFKPEVVEPPLSLESKVGFGLFAIGYIVMGYASVRRLRFSKVFPLLVRRAKS